MKASRCTRRRTVQWGAGSALAILAATAAINWQVLRTGEAHMVSAAYRIEPAPAAIVLGALARPDGSPSDILEDRLVQGIELYRSGKAKKLLLSGDHGKSE